MTEADFQNALDCYVSSSHSSCSHIRIPHGVTLHVDSTFFLNNNHGGLHIEIIGTIEFTESYQDACLFDVNGTDDLTFDGGRHDHRDR